jgi:hypothetical protein
MTSSGGLHHGRSSREAMLIPFICLFIKEAHKTGKAPKKDLLDWTFFELLDVAKQAKLLPEELTLEEDWISAQ